MKTVICGIMLIMVVSVSHAWDKSADEELRQIKLQMQYQHHVDNIRYNDQRQQPHWQIQQLNPAIILQGQTPNLMDNYYRAYDAARR